MGTASWVAKKGANNKARTWADKTEFNRAGKLDQETLCLARTSKQPEE